MAAITVQDIKTQVELKRALTGQRVHIGDLHEVLHGWPQMVSPHLDKLRQVVRQFMKGCLSLDPLVFRPDLL